MNEILAEVLTAIGWLLCPVWLAVIVCFVRGIRADIGERRAAKNG